jgi:hypothetical protein
MTILSDIYYSTETGHWYLSRSVNSVEAYRISCGTGDCSSIYCSGREGEVIESFRDKLYLHNNSSPKWIMPPQAILEKLGVNNMPIPDNSVAKRILEEKLYPENPFQLYKFNGKPAPAHISVITAGEYVEIKGCTFVVQFVDDDTVLLKPVVGPVIVGEKEGEK